MMPQIHLLFQYAADKNETGLTSFSGLPLYIETANVSGLCAAIKNGLQTKGQGWNDLQIILSLILLNLAGGDCVEDVERLESDEGLSTILVKAETHGMKRKERCAHEQRFRKAKGRALPSVKMLKVRKLKVARNGQRFASSPTGLASQRKRPITVILVFVSQWRNNRKSRG